MNAMSNHEYNSPLMGEHELAAELLEVQNEQELAAWVGKVAKGAFNGVRKFYNSPYGNRLRTDFVKTMKKAAGRMIPSLARNVGGYLGGDRGATLGRRIGGAVGDYVMSRPVTSPGVAQAFTNMVSNAAKMVAAAPPNIPTLPLVNQAITRAYQGVGGVRRPYPVKKRRAGTYIRKGTTITLR